MTQPGETNIRKVLVSPWFGAGWSSWASGGRDLEEFYLFDPGLIESIEQHGHVTDEAMADFERRELERFGSTQYKGGAGGLVIEEVAEPFRIQEYDGSETIVLKSEDEESWR
ncbi:MAG TPA: hypothetical protein VFI54_06405 [Solirubrobacteraceae bacterium]|nr:hypothetical protein [Solirubrobacteraceae bacterium]